MLPWREPQYTHYFIPLSSPQLTMNGRALLCTLEDLMLEVKAEQKVPIGFMFTDDSEASGEVWRIV